MKVNKICIVLAACIFITAFPKTIAYAEPTSTDNQSQQMDDLKKQYDQNEANITSLEDNIEKLDNDLSILTIKIKDTDKEIQKTNSDLEEQNENLEKSKEIMDERLRGIYKSDTTTVDYMDLLFKSDNLSDLISKVTFAKKLADSDKKTVDDVQKYKDSVEELKSQQEELQKTQNDQQKELEAKKADQNNQMQELLKIRQTTGNLLLNTDATMLDPLLQIANTSQSKAELSNIVTTFQKLKDVVKVAETNKKIDGAIPVINTKISSLNAQPEVPADKANAIVIEAYKYISIPYLWGGDNPSTGMDCSGFTSYVYKQFGYDITRTTYTQVNQGTQVDVALDKLKVGDLIFFGDPSAPHHVGIYVGNNMYIHAPHTGDVIKVSSGALTASTARRIIQN